MLVASSPYGMTSVALTPKGVSNIFYTMEDQKVRYNKYKHDLWKEWRARIITEGLLALTDI